MLQNIFSKQITLSQWQWNMIGFQIKFNSEPKDLIQILFPRNQESSGVGFISISSHYNALEFWIQPDILSFLICEMGLITRSEFRFVGPKIYTFEEVFFKKHSTKVCTL